MTGKRQSLFQRILPRVRRTCFSNENPNASTKKSLAFQTCGGVYKSTRRSMMIIKEDEQENGSDRDNNCSLLAKKLQSLNDGMSVSTAMTSETSCCSSSESSFDDDLCSSHSFRLTRQASSRRLICNLDDDDDDDDQEEPVSDDRNVINNKQHLTNGWKSSGDDRHHEGAPLIALRSQSQRIIDPKRPELQLEDDEVLQKVLVHAARKLPRNCGNFASLHVMINNERIKHQVAPLQRVPALDELAREHASFMAKNQTLAHGDLKELREKLEETSVITSAASQSAQRIGSNVCWCSGGDLSIMHETMMKESVADRNNILDRRYTQMGVGTFKCLEDGKLYVCELFI